MPVDGRGVPPVPPPRGYATVDTIIRDNIQLSKKPKVFSFALIFFFSFYFVYAMRKCAAYMGSTFQAELILLVKWLIYLLFAYDVCVANKIDIGE